MAGRGRYINGPVPDRDVYAEQTAFIRQYGRFCELLDYLDEDSMLPVMRYGDKVDGKPVTGPLEDHALLKVSIERKKACIDKGLAAIPEEYRKLLMKNICEKVSFTDSAFDCAHMQTWKYWKNMLIWEVARERGDEEYMRLLSAYTSKKGK